jgi:methyl-accepting chemotaxis protein
MSFRSKLLLVPVVVIGSILVGWGAGFLFGSLASWSVTVLSVILIILLTRNLLITSADSVDRMNRTVKALSDGKMDMTLRADAARESGEVGVLENGLASLALSHHNFMNDLNELVGRVSTGSADSKLDMKNLSGGLRDIATNINSIVTNCEKVNTAILDMIEGFAKGEFNKSLNIAHPRAADVGDKLRERLMTLKNDAETIASAAKEGRLSARASTNYPGEWARIPSDMNTVIDAVSRPLSDIATALERYEAANFMSGASGQFPGDFAKIKELLDRIGKNYAGHLSEISTVLGDISFGRGAEMTREYRGAFSSVASAVSSVARSSERLADEINRAKNTATQTRTIVPTRPVPSGTPPPPIPSGTPPRPAPTPLRPAAAGVATAANKAFGAATSAASAARVATAATASSRASVTPPMSTRAPLQQATGGLPTSSHGPGKVFVPSGAHEYNKKDFGKYK